MISPTVTTRHSESWISFSLRRFNDVCVWLVCAIRWEHLRDSQGCFGDDKGRECSLVLLLELSSVSFAFGGRPLLFRVTESNCLRCWCRHWPLVRLKSLLMGGYPLAGKGNAGKCVVRVVLSSS